METCIPSSLQGTQVTNGMKLILLISIFYSQDQRFSEHVLDWVSACLLSFQCYLWMLRTRWGLRDVQTRNQNSEENFDWQWSLWLQPKLKFNLMVQDERCQTATGCSLAINWLKYNLRQVIFFNCATVAVSGQTTYRDGGMWFKMARHQIPISPETYQVISAGEN